jgi:hypothetical protein
MYKWREPASMQGQSNEPRPMAHAALQTLGSPGRGILDLLKTNLTWIEVGLRMYVCSGSGRSRWAICMQWLIGDSVHVPPACGVNGWYIRPSRGTGPFHALRQMALGELYWCSSRLPGCSVPQATRTHTHTHEYEITTTTIASKVACLVNALLCGLCQCCLPLRIGRVHDEAFQRDAECKRPLCTRGHQHGSSIRTIHYARHTFGFETLSS